MSVYDEIKESLNLPDFIKHRYPDIDLRPDGSVHKMLCLWHTEKTPSCVVYERNYKCFGCHESGDVFDLIQHLESVDIKDAAVIAGAFCGVKVNFTPPNPHHESYKNLMAEHANRYHMNLYHDPNAIHYLTNVRRWTDQTIKKFWLGLVPDNEYYKHRQDITGIGNRISFPILEQKSYSQDIRPIAMGYRATDDSEPKYKNDRNQTETNSPLYGVFIKSKTIYNYSRAKSEIIRKKYAIVTEGYADVISMDQSGFENTVGLMTSSMTEDQADALKKVTSVLTIIFDGDAAGIKGLYSVLPMLLRKGFSVNTVILENGEDLSDLCSRMNFSHEFIEMYINAKAKPALQAIIDLETEQYQRYVSNYQLSTMSKMGPLLDSVMNCGDRLFYESYLKKALGLY